jgi:hypothetical protein
MNRTLPIAAFALLSWMWSWSKSGQPAPLSPDREIASLLPERCRIYLEGTGTLPLLEHGLEHPLVRAFRSSALGAALLSRFPRSPDQALEAADVWLGRPVLPLVADLTRRGVGLGFDPASKKTVIVALGRDADSVVSELAAVFGALERQLGWPCALSRPHEHLSGADLWALGDEAFVARRDALLVLANERELVTDVLDLAADPTARGLFERPGFAALHAGRSPDSTLWAWLELAEIEPHSDQGFRELRAANHSPAAQGLLGAELSALLAARALSATLSLAEDRGLELSLRAFEAPCLATLVPQARTGAVPAELGGETVATALLYRDYGRFFAQRAELFPTEALAGFAEVITNGALFFEGKDLGEEVLPRLSPWIRLVSRELEFGAGRRPEIPLPGLAAVAVLDDEREGEHWVAAFQTIISLINVDQAQKGGKSLRLHLTHEGEVEISAARFATPNPGDGVDMRYNLEPALAVVGRHLVLGTHESLVRALVRELERASPGIPQGRSETLEVAARGLRAAVDQNFELLVARKMLADGLERGAAESEIEGLRLALAAFESAHIEVGGDDPTAPELRIELQLSRRVGPR